MPTGGLGAGYVGARSQNVFGADPGRSGDEGREEDASYRRAEQPLRICVWYGTNGMGTIMASAFAYGFGSSKNPKIHVYQMIFLFCGLLTVCTGPFVYWRLPNSMSEAKFLSPEDRKKAVERVRANNTGTKATDKFKWRQALEAGLEPKTWLFCAMTLCVNFGASVTLTFGPLILNGIGFDKFKTSLLNMPFGAFQIIVIFFASYAAYFFRIKSLVMATLVLPVLAGLVILYALPRPNEGGLLAGYYLLAFLYGANPLIVSWISANTAGSTKKSVVLAAYNAASSCGNIVGPLLFKDEDSPLYRHGLLACIGIFAALAASIGLQILSFFVLNRLKRAQRVRNGKPADFHDASMDKRFRQQHAVVAEPDADKLEAETAGVVLGDNALLDLTDWQNDERLARQRLKQWPPRPAPPAPSPHRSRWLRRRQTEVGVPGKGELGVLPPASGGAAHPGSSDSGSARAIRRRQTRAPPRAPQLERRLRLRLLNPIRGPADGGGGSLGRGAHRNGWRGTKQRAKKGPRARRAVELDESAVYFTRDAFRCKPNMSTRRIDMNKSVNKMKEKGEERRTGIRWGKKKNGSERKKDGRRGREG
ncbi:major facilitator superfamily domain-containing protein [Mycena latifolia]|nr:major facilitator superfamily domain-containing protein [Mycena latifolia]